MTIDLGGHTVTRTAAPADDNGSAFRVDGDYDVTIKNGAIDCSGVDDTSVIGDGVFAIDVKNGGDLTLAGLDITVDSRNGACVYPWAGSTVTIESGNYANRTDEPYDYHKDANGQKDWQGMAVNQANVAESLITITGGTFSQMNPMLGDDSAAPGSMSFVDPAYFAEDGTGVFTVVPRIDIAPAVVTLADEVVYAGTNLVEGTDYVVTYADNVAAGEDTAAATIVGTNLWTGTVAKTFSIAKKPVTFTGASADKVYDGTALSTNDFSVVGLLAGHTATATVTGSQTNVGTSSNVVSAAVIADGDSNDVTANYAINYVDGELEVTPASITITVAGTPSTAVYNGENQATNIAWTATEKTATGLFDAEKVVRDAQAATTVTGKDVDTYAYGLAASQFSYDDANVEAQFEVADASFAITKKAIEITVAGVNATSVYTGEEQTTNVAWTATCEGETLFEAEKVSYAGTATVSGTAAKDYAYNIDITKFAYADTNIEASFTLASDGTFAITAATVQIPAAPGNKVYNGQNQTAEVTAPETVTVTNAGGKDVGDYTVTFALADPANYTWSDGSVTNQVFGWSITKAAATITVADASKKHGEKDPAFNGQVEGLFDANDLGTVTYARTNDTEAVGVYAGVIVPTYTANANYEVTVTPGTFTIESNLMTIIWVADGAETTNKVEWGTAVADFKPSDPTKTDATGKYGYLFAGWSPEVTPATNDATYVASFTQSIATPLALPLADHAVDATVTPLEKKARVELTAVGAIEDVQFSASPATAAWDAGTLSFSGLGWNEGVTWSVSAQQGADAFAEAARNEGAFYAKPSASWFSITTNDLADAADASDASVAYTHETASNEGEMVRVHTKIAVPAGGLPAEPATGSAKVGFAVLQLDNDAAPAYYAFGNGTWTKLSGAAPSEGEHDYLAVYDLAAAAPTARYYIDGVALYAAVDGGDDVYALPLAAATTSLTGISFASKEMVKDDIVAVQDTSYVAAVGETPYTDGDAAVAAQGMDAAKTMALLKQNVAIAPVTLGIGDTFVVDYAKGSFTNDSPAVSGVPGYAVKVAEAETVKSYALDPIVYPIEYVLGGGDNDPSNTNEYTVADLPLALADATRTGYRFDGWTNNFSANAVVTSIPVGTIGAVTNVATWTINDYLLTINYLYTNGTVAATQFTSNVVYDTAYSVDSPAITGYTADKPTVSGTMGAGAVTIDVTYTIDRHTVTFFDEDGTTVLKAATEYDYGTPATAIAQPETTPTKAATGEWVFTFAGWKPELAAVTNDAVYTATYSSNKTVATVITIADNGDGTATTNETYYASLADALDAAESGDTVRLDADVSEPAVALDTPVTLDLNGNTWTVTPAEGADAPGTVEVSAAVSVVDSSENGGGAIASAAEPVVTVAQGGALTVGEGAAISLPERSFG